ncbi:NUDIX hydrolase [Candidatus Woesebacteria bacterium]|nr:NUDIX hydrolase [Candidatus Woesebacteria bacterium]
MDELVDIIDPTEVVVATVPKSQAHKEGLLHKTVISQLINSRGEFCFVRQSSDKQDAGQFVSPVGGHVSAGESDDATLIRECQEECGITPTNYKLIGTTIYNREVIGRRENHFFVVYEIYTDEDPVLNHESVEFKWFTKEDIKSLVQSNPANFGEAWHHVFKTFYPSIYNI